MNKVQRYYFGEKALSGFVRQKLDDNNELYYRGVIHIFGAKVPVYLSIEPMDKYIKGEKMFKVFTYLTPIPAANKGSVLEVSLKSANTQRLNAIKKVKEVMTKLGEVYEAQKYWKEQHDKEICKQCRKGIENEWRAKLQEAVRGNVERQREIRKRAVQRVLATRKRNKRKANKHSMGRRNENNAGLS